MTRTSSEVVVYWCRFAAAGGIAAAHTGVRPLGIQDRKIAHTQDVIKQILRSIECQPIA